MDINNNDNLYSTTEHGQSHGYMQPQPLTPAPPAAKKKNRLSGGIIALSLTLALVGGLVGGTATGYYFSRHAAGAPQTSFTGNTGGSPATSLASSDTKSINSIYETYKSSVVGIRNDSTRTNVFGQEVPMASAGSGFIISTDGYILTNNHVVENADKLTVTLFDETSYPATVVGTDPDNDVALLKINAANLNTVKLGNSDNLVVGETVLAIGNPLGELTYTVTAGIVSAENREINENGIPINMFQTDAAINPGNSGGPVFNLSGEVVGISTAKYASAEVEGIGFAIPINDAIKIADQLKATGHAKGRPYLGISVADAGNPQSGSTFGDGEGVYVAAVDPNGGAAKAGVLKGDLITALNGKVIKSSSALIAALKDLDAGSTVNITVSRDGKTITLSVTLGESKPNV